MEDSKEMEEENNTDMVFDRHPTKTRKADEKDLQIKLLQALYTA